MIELREFFARGAEILALTWNAWRIRPSVRLLAFHMVARVI
jgi:hypothetical protein